MALERTNTGRLGGRARWVRQIVLAALLTPALSLAFAKDPVVLQAVVVAVSDGDTFVARALAGDGSAGARIDVRLHLVDAPEICHRVIDAQCRRPGQPHGEVAAAALRSLVQGRVVELRCMGRSYNREVCSVRVGTVDVALELVGAGHVWYAPYRSERSSSLNASMLAAQIARRGLWTEASPIRPSDWRRACWEGGRCPL